MNEIPKIIHQTWKNEDIPQLWADFAESWKRNHPSWQYQFWTDETSRAFIAKYYPEFLGHYDAYSYPIQRVDAFRYLLLLQCGGIYADLDTESLQPLDSLLSGQTFVAAREPAIHCSWVGNRKMLGNAILAAVPGHAFLAAVLERLKNRSPRIVVHQEVLDSTGPIMLHSVLDRYEQNDVCILPSKVFYQSSKELTSSKLLDPTDPSAEEIKENFKMDGAYTIHYWENTWTQNPTGEELVNDTPNEIPGFVFFPGRDSVGWDLSNNGRNILEVAETWREDETVAGFNTDGFVKSYIRPKFQWRREPSYQQNEGLYVKTEFIRPYVAPAILGIRAKRRNFDQ